MDTNVDHTRRLGHSGLARTPAGRLLTAELGTIGKAWASLEEIAGMERIKVDENYIFMEMNEVE